MNTFNPTPENITGAMRAMRVIFKGELSERESKILGRRFGVEYTDPKTLEEVGKEFGVTRERIRQIETKAMMKVSNFLTAIQMEEKSDDESGKQINKKSANAVKRQT